MQNHVNGTEFGRTVIKHFDTFYHVLRGGRNSTRKIDSKKVTWAFELNNL